MGLVACAKATWILPGCLHPPFSAISPTAPKEERDLYREHLTPQSPPFPTTQVLLQLTKYPFPCWGGIFCNTLRANAAHLSRPPLQWLLCRCQPQASRLVPPWHSSASGHLGLEAMSLNSSPSRDHGTKQRCSCCPGMNRGHWARSRQDRPRQHRPRAAGQWPCSDVSPAK